MPRGLCILVLVLAASPLVAGMPLVTISDLWTMRLQSISFFLLVLAVSALGVMALWNYLRRDFTTLPRLTYLRSLSLVILLGLLFMVVLTMISGARELMTPGAWAKQGATYAVQDDQSISARRERLFALREALWKYADANEGRLPPHDAGSDIPGERWLAPDGRRYVYLPGAPRGGSLTVIAYEQGPVGRLVLALFNDGTINERKVSSIDRSAP